MNALKNMSLRAFSDEKFNAAQKTISLFRRIRILVEKGENTCCQHFLLFPQCFSKLSSSGSF